MAALWRKVADRIRKTRAVFTEGLQQAFGRGGALDEGFYEQLEDLLLAGDIGLDTTLALIERVRALAREHGVGEVAAARALLAEAVTEILARGSAPEGGEDERAAMPAADDPATPTAGGASPEGPRVILVVGVNGVGKTTSIGKLAWRHTQQGQTTLVVASDTFRAAALEQLTIWAERAGAELVRSQPGADPAAVAYDGVSAGRARGAEVVIIDTAGRLQTNANLMAELGKIRRAVGKALPGAPHEVLLVLDATTGQNAISQARTFAAAVEVTGIFLAKLDGTAKGGVILAIADQLGIPVRYVGLGEGLEDIAEFEPDEFARALLEPLAVGASE